MKRALPWRLVLALGLAWAAAAPARGADPNAAAEAPSRRWMEIRAYAARGAYLDVTLADEERTLRLFLPARDECRALVDGKPRVRFLPQGGGGLLADDSGMRCAPVGTTAALLFSSSRSLPRDWQRERSEIHPPRVLAEYTPVHQDDELLQVRGRFPLATELRWAAAMDTVALLPNRPDCQELVRRGAATLELDRGADEPLRLLAPGSSCPILGFAIPLEDESPGP